MGVNEYVDEPTAPPKIVRDETAEADQRARLEQYKSDRSKGDPAEPWRTECEKLTAMADAGKTSGYCEQVYSALKAGATEGEIVKALETVWGRYRPAV